MSLDEFDDLDKYFDDIQPAKSTKRKLPGPAGLLSKSLEDSNMIDKRSRLLNNLHTDEASEQVSFRELSQKESECLMKKVEDHCGSLENWQIIKKYSIDHVLKLAKENRLPKGKIPVLCAFLVSMEPHITSAKGILKDINGNTINCTLHRDLSVKVKHKLLRSKILLLLKNITIYNLTNKQYYCNLTFANLVKIFDLHEPLDDHISLFEPYELQTLENDLMSKKLSIDKSHKSFSPQILSRTPLVDFRTLLNCKQSEIVPEEYPVDEFDEILANSLFDC